jgi:hypothetical protein
MFVVYGTSLVMLILGYSMFFTFRLQGEQGYPKELLLMTIPFVILIVFLVYLSGKIAVARKAIEAFSGRAVIFLYLSVPVSLISLCIVIARNLF